MNKGQRLYKFILGLLMPFLFLACSSKERIKIDGGTSMLTVRMCS